VQVKVRGQFAAGCPLERGVRPQHRIVGVARHVEAARRQQRIQGRRDEQDVVQVDRLDGGPDVVKAVVAFRDDLEVQVQLGARRER
jgi:hypothetical protein